jgi:hypothetical protein
MLRYVFRRFLTAIPTLFLIVTISFFLMRVAPGGPFNQEKGLNPVIKANLERVYHLDEPLWKQYLLYLNNLLHGDFGPSYNLPDFTVAELFANGCRFRNWATALIRRFSWRRRHRRGATESRFTRTPPPRRVDHPPFVIAPLQLAFVLPCIGSRSAAGEGALVAGGRF